MNRHRLMLAAAALSVAALSVAPSVAYAGETVVQAVQVGDETIRYDKGVPTLDLVKSRGAVQVTPLGMDHGSYVFGVAVFNGTDVPVNFDITDVSVQVGSQPVGVFTVDQLISKAKSRKTWSQIGIALIGGISAAASASQRDHYYGSYHSKYGSAYSRVSAPSLAGQLQAQRIQDDTADALGQMQAQLDETRARLGDEIVQMTTVDQRGSYAGKIILAKIKPSALPQQIAIAVNWNGQVYPFAFQVSRSGTPAPAFVPKPMQPMPMQPAVVREDYAAPVPAPQVASAPLRAGRPARDVSDSDVRPASLTRYASEPATPPIPAPTPARYVAAPQAAFAPVRADYAPTPPRMLSGGLIEVPAKPSAWASRIDPLTGDVVPIDPAAIGGLMVVSR
jgi:hypothetical protein